MTAAKTPPLDFAYICRRARLLGSFEPNSYSRFGLPIEARFKAVYRAIVHDSVLSLGQEEIVFAEFSAAYTESANKLLVEWRAEEPTEPDLPPVKTRAKRKFVYANGSKPSFWVRLLAFVGLMFACCRCSAGLPWDYHVIIDRQTVSPMLAQAVIDAVDNWQAMTPGLGIDYVMGDCTDEHGPYGTICVRAFSGPGPAGAEQEAATQGNSYIPTAAVVRLYPDDFYTDIPARVVAHELGHAMGLIHTGPGTLMCWTNTCSNSNVTPADVEQWQTVHRQ